MNIPLGFFTLVLDVSNSEILMLLFLILLTFGAFLYMKRLRKDRVTKLGNYKTLEKVHDTNSLGSPIILASKILIVTLLFLTATGSIEVRASQPVTDTQFTVTLDTSQSMLMPDYDPSRLGYAKTGINEWIRNMPFEANISVVEFAREGRIRSLMTMDESQMTSAVNEIEVDLNQSGSRLDYGLEKALETGNNQNQNQRVLVVTDGENLREREINRSLSIAQDTSAEIYIFKIPRNEETIQFENQLNLSATSTGFESTDGGNSIESLRRIADASGGSYYSIENSQFFSAALQDAYTEESRVGINSNLYILIFLSFFVISEMLLYSKYGAL